MRYSTTKRKRFRNRSKDVRQKGHQWLQKEGIALDAPPPDSSKLPSYWRKYNGYLWESYGRICSYLCIYFDIVLGAVTTDHFIAKSAHAGQAYEWENYRLACLGANQHKNKYDDVLDPFTLPKDTFFLALDIGKIYVNPGLKKTDEKLYESAQKTIERLNLDSRNHRSMRQKWCQDYIMEKINGSFLMEQNPFVYYEMKRQNWLRCGG